MVMVRPVLRDRCPVCNVGVLWPNGWMDQDATWYEIGLGSGDIVLEGDPQKGAQHEFELWSGVQ